ncbi:hypothetical protein CR513_62625, partial [Mucuna pruriens]
MSSDFNPTGISQLNELRRFAVMSSTVAIPSDMPGQILRPAPNGIISKSCPLKSISLMEVVVNDLLEKDIESLESGFKTRKQAGEFINPA